MVFGILTFLVSHGLTSDADLTATLAVQRLTFPGGVADDRGELDRVSPQSWLLVVGMAALFWLAGYRAEASCSVAAGAANMLAETIKHVIARPRPEATWLTSSRVHGGQSFPSGHVLFYVTFFGFLAYVTYAQFKRGLLRTTLLWIFGLLMVLVGPSRIWMGQHWASDVLASYTLGFACLVLLIEIYSRYRFHRTAVTGATT